MKNKKNNKLIKARQESGLKIKDIIKKADITRQALWQYETGVRRPQDKIKIKLAKIYQKSIEELFY